jgi:hypothetical protein
LATLFHSDFPQALQEVGGWENRDSASWFADYAETIFAKLDGVDRWVTINEPKIIVQQGYQRGGDGAREAGRPGGRSSAASPGVGSLPGGPGFPGVGSAGGDWAVFRHHPVLPSGRLR